MVNDSVLKGIESKLGISLEPNIHIYAGYSTDDPDDPDRFYVNSIKIKGRVTIHTGIGGFQTYIESGGIITGIVLNGVVLDKDMETEVVEAVRTGHFIRINTEKQE